MEDFDALLDGLNGNPDDAGTLMLLSETYEDQGDQAGAEAIRWAAASGKRPYVEEDKKTGSWFNGDKIKDAELGDDYSDLPEVVYTHLAVGEGAGQETANHRTYESVKGAFLAFVAAYSKAVKEGKVIPPPAKSYQEFADELMAKRSEEHKAKRAK
jgi:hypothetical protein